MQPAGGEMTELNHHHLLLPSNQSQFPTDHFNFTHNTTFQLSRFSNVNPPNNNNIYLHITPNINQDFMISSTSDEAEEQQLSMMINERRQRRMISNRESARRSRMRKQKHMDELWSQVTWLRNENHQLLDKLNHVSESHDQVLQENVHLKEEASELRQILMTQMHDLTYDP